MMPERIGPYRIVRLLGKGGMGAVYEGIHEAIERRVAIKVLHAELGRRADLSTRFINEARAVNRIDHPGLVQVSDYGQLPDGTAYIVMEFLKGDTLGQRLKRIGGRLPTADVIRLGRQLGSALAAAHDKDIVHRDLKPDNIMIVPNPDSPNGEQCKILDFGIAKVAEAQSGISEAHTRADALLGTPRYMSPEQCRGSGRVDALSDVYSLGVIFYEILTGAPPFSGSAHGELIVQHMMQEPPPLAPLVEPGTPEALVQLVHRMLLKDKDARPTMRQVVSEMDRMGGYLSGVYGVLPLNPSAISMPGMTGAMPVLTAPSGYPSLAGPPGMQSMPGVAGMPPHHSLVGMTAMQIQGMAGQPSTLGLSAGQTPVPPRPRRAVAVAVGSIVGVALVGVLLLITLNKPKPLPPPLVPVERPRSVVERPPPEPPKKTIHWALTTQPAGAMVIRQRDGQVLGVTPLSVENPAGSGSEKVRIMLPGYADEIVILDLDADSEQKIDLRRKTGRDAKRNKNGKGYVPGDLTVVD